MQLLSRKTRVAGALLMTFGRVGSICPSSLIESDLIHLTHWALGKTVSPCGWGF
jgi:hypothetical protein